MLLPAREVGQVRAELLQRVVGVLRLVAGHARVAADRLQLLQKRVAREAELGKDALESGVRLFKQRQHDVLDRHVFVLHV